MHCLRYQQCLSLDPNMAVAYQNMGKSLGRMRRFDESIACFERAIQLRPAYVNAYKNKAEALYFKGDLEAAMRRAPASAATGARRCRNPCNIGMLWLLVWRCGSRLARIRMAAGKRRMGRLPALTQPLWDGSSLDGKRFC